MCRERLPGRLVSRHVSAPAPAPAPDQPRRSLVSLLLADLAPGGVHWVAWLDHVLKSPHVLLVQLDLAGGHVLLEVPD
jgi:hypothetical protein